MRTFYAVARRTLAVAAGVLALTAGLLVHAAPAQAHHVNEDISGVWYPWPAPTHADANTNARILRALKTAKLQWDQGDQYVWGGKGPSTFDCSGLIYYSYHNASVTWAYHTARALYEDASYPGHVTGRRVGRWEVKPGDLIFYSSNGQSSGIYHVAIYLGWNSGSQKNEQIEAYNEATDIRIMPYRETQALNEVVRVLG